ncbi:MAG: HIT domain-containing protein [Rhodanobacteraceae bacterium]|nr:MAG: HIT domain-containing protein [Rhodanobacteraceae bacterium]
MSTNPEAGFELDPRLAADTIQVADWDLCRVLLMNDAQFPWLVLVPRRRGLAELDDLDPGDRALLLQEIQRAMQTLRNAVAYDKFNVGALGNIVRQLHIHVIARRRTDAAWPGPVWGYGRAVAYAPDARDRLLTALRWAGDG